MGLDFLRDKAEKFRQLRDRAALKVHEAGSLLDTKKPARVIEEYQCKLVEGCSAPPIGQSAMARVLSDAVVSVIQASRVIAYMLTEDGVRLIAFMKANQHLGGVIKLVTKTDPTFDGVFRVRVARL